MSSRRKSATVDLREVMQRQAATLAADRGVSLAEVRHAEYWHELRGSWTLTSRWEVLTDGAWVDAGWCDELYRCGALTP
ncbi:MAG: hypothetical protein AAGJ46_06595 [Planctomycetota bacterium]